MLWILIRITSALILMSTHNMFLWRTTENYPYLFHCKMDDFEVVLIVSMENHEVETDFWKIHF